MGRHAAPRASSVAGPAPLTRTSHRAPKTSRRKPKPDRALWRRSPVIPAAAVVLAVWGGADALQLTGSTSTHAATVADAASTVDLGAAAAGSQVGLLAAGARVSRKSRELTRSLTDSALAQQASADPVPPRKTAVPKTAAVPKVAAKAAPSKPMTAKTLPGTPVAAMLAPGQTVPGIWVRPSAGAESSCFCMRWGTMHQGIDLAGPMNSPILSVGDGVVVQAGPAEGFGLWVVIRQTNGDITVYGHMYHFFVHAGEYVTAGQHIADIGANGESTGPHLHFGVRQGGIDGPYIDPVPWLKARGIDVGAYDPNA